MTESRVSCRTNKRDQIVKQIEHEISSNQYLHNIETLFVPSPESNNSQRQSIRATASETDLCRMAFESLVDS